jgi:hypothetical protein
MSVLQSLPYSGPIGCRRFHISQSQLQRWPRDEAQTSLRWRFLHLSGRATVFPRPVAGSQLPRASLSHLGHRVSPLLRSQSSTQTPKQRQKRRQRAALATFRTLLHAVTKLFGRVSQDPRLGSRDGGLTVRILVEQFRVRSTSAFRSPPLACRSGELLLSTLRQQMPPTKG